MIGAHELTMTEPSFLLVLLAVAAVVAIACHLHRDLARERHHQRKNGGL